MALSPPPATSSRSDRRAHVQRLAAPVLALILAGSAFAVRLHGITDPLVLFHAMRHYRSALIARACFDDHEATTPAWARRVADANRDIQPAGEPPIMEMVACAVDRVRGREDVVMPRAFAAASWVFGALPLWLLAQRLTSRTSALVAIALYLFLPYAIIATRSFQPDALMTMCVLWAVLAAVRWRDRATHRTTFEASALLGVAVLVKPMAIFLVVPAVLSARSRTVTSKIRVIAAGLVPATLYYGWAAIFGTLVRDQMSTRFVPALVATSFFWHGWAVQIGRVIGWPWMLVAVAGTWFGPDGDGRRLLAALWIGYAAFAIAFTYHVPTHDYYHLPYVAAAALGVAGVAERLCRLIADRVGHLATQALIWIAVLAIALGGSAVAWPRLTVSRATSLVATYARLGDITHHSTRVLFLDLEYGYPLMYHGQMAGDEWPNTDDLAWIIHEKGEVVETQTPPRGYSVVLSH